MTRKEKETLLNMLTGQRDKLNEQIGTLVRELNPELMRPWTKKQLEAHHAAQIRQQQQDGA